MQQDQNWNHDHHRVYLPKSSSDRGWDFRPYRSDSRLPVYTISFVGAVVFLAIAAWVWSGTPA